MSHYLDAAACEDAQRREDLARTDAAMAHGITRVSLARVSGRHLSEAPNEPVADPKITDAWHRANDARALALQQQHLDAMRRAGL